MVFGYLDMAALLEEKYKGKISKLIEAAENKQDLEGRLQEIKGVGPKVTEIFLRDVKI